MTSFDHPTNYVVDLETLIRKAKAKLWKKIPPTLSEEDQPRRSLTPTFEAMAKTLHEFSAPTTANIRTRPTVNVGDEGFELKLALINMVQGNQLYGKAHEDASAHLQHFLEICSTFTLKGVSKDAILLCLFPFSLLGRAKQWFYMNKDKNTTWDICSTAFLAKLFLVGKTNTLHAKVATFQQQYEKSIPEAWECFQDYISECPHHGMKDWLLMQTFYHRLTASAHENMDAAAGGSFLSLTILQATALVEKIASN